ncbi:MAG: DEAD/DEAH box helicase [Candidatus Aenigmatarchaeota archaeon]
MSFQKLELDEKILRALHILGFTEATEIQQKALPDVLKGKDAIVQSMTGSGKTAVFAIQALQRASKTEGVQVLIIAPTRELAEQIAEHISKIGRFTGINVCKIYGGVSMDPQIYNLRKSQIVVGTPGRLMDHMRRGNLSLSNIKLLVLDEADRMLDMGFVDDIEAIVRQTPRQRQTILCSATIPDKIRHLVRRYMKDPIKVSAQKFVSDQKLKQYYIDANQREKISTLINVIKKEKPELAIVFCGTRHATDFVTTYLERAGIEAKAIHGGLKQQSRMSVLDGFHKGRTHILVATDVAARGLDIKNVSHIFNFDVPKTPEEYTHRIGRTARIGKDGKSITIITKNDHDVFRKILEWNKGIEKYKME